MKYVKKIISKQFVSYLLCLFMIMTSFTCPAYAETIIGDITTEDASDSYTVEDYILSDIKDSEVYNITSEDESILSNDAYNNSGFVNNIQKMYVKMYTKNYHIGDNFDGKGRLYIDFISNDKYQTYIVPLSELNLTGFDSSVEGPRTIVGFYEGEQFSFDVYFHKEDYSIPEEYNISLMNTSIIYEAYLGIQDRQSVICTVYADGYATITGNGYYYPPGYLYLNDWNSIVGKINKLYISPNVCLYTTTKLYPPSLTHDMIYKTRVIGDNTIGFTSKVVDDFSTGPNGSVYKTIFEPLNPCSIPKPFTTRVVDDSDYLVGVHSYNIQFRNVIEFDACALDMHEYYSNSHYKSNRGGSGVVEILFTQDTKYTPKFIGHSCNGETTDVKFSLYSNRDLELGETNEDGLIGFNVNSISEYITSIRGLNAYRWEDTRLRHLGNFAWYATKVNDFNFHINGKYAHSEVPFNFSACPDTTANIGVCADGYITIIYPRVSKTLPSIPISDRSNETILHTNGPVTISSCSTHYPTVYFYNNPVTFSTNSTNTSGTEISSTGSETWSLVYKGRPVYYVGESFEYADVLMKQTLERNITYDQIYTVDQSQISGVDTSKAGNKTLTVTYNGVKYTAPYSVVERPKAPTTSDGSAPTLSSISISGTTNTYYVGDVFDGKGIVTLNFSDGSIQTFSPSLSLLSGFDTSTAGIKTITVNYGGKSCTYKITVKADTVASSSFSGVTTMYTVGATHDKIGYLDLVYASGKTERVPLSSATCTVTTTKAGSSTATVKYNGGTYTYTIQVKEALALSSISVLGQTTTYYVGDIFDGKGNVTLKYNDGTTQTIMLAYSLLSGFTTASAGTKIVTVSYGNKTCTYKITVKADTVKSTSFSSITTQYKYGQPFDGSGYLDIVWNSGKTEKIPLSTLTVKANTKQMGSSTVSVTYGGKTYTYNITVDGYAISSITPQSYTTSFYKDSVYDYKGSLKVTYSDGTYDTVAITSDMVKQFDSSTPGTSTVILEYLGNTVTYTVAIQELTVLSITVSGQTTKFKKGNSFDNVGTMNIVYENGATNKIPLTSNMLAVFDTSKEGKSTVVVSYGGKTTTYGITVEALSIEDASITGQVTSYTKGQPFVAEGTITVSYENGTFETVSVTEDMVKTFDTSTPGTSTVILTVNGFNVSYEITVEDLVLEDFDIMEVTKQYKRNQKFDGKGYLLAKYDDGSRKQIPITELMITNFDTSQIDDSVEVHIVFDGIDKTYTINVIELAITAVTPIDFKDTYYKNEYFKEQGNLRVTYEDDSIELKPIKSSMVKTFDTSSTGTKTVTLVFNGKEYTYNITVTNAKVNSVVLKDQTTTYSRDTEFDNIGIMEVTYTSGDVVEIPISNATISKFDTSKVGTTNVILSYEGQIITYDINVVEKIVSNTILDNHVTSYKWKQDFVEQGNVIIAFEDGTTETIPITKDIVKEFSTLTAGSSIPVTLTVFGHDVTYNIEVVELTVTNMEFIGHKTSYRLNESYVSDGSVKITYNDGSTETIALSEFNVTLDTSSLGTARAEFEYLNETFGFDVEVVKWAITSIAPVNHNTSYVRYQEFVDSGSITVTREDTNYETVPMSEVTITGFDTANLGEAIVTAEYEGFTFEFPIMVSETIVSSISVKNMTTGYRKHNAFDGEGTVVVNFDGKPSVEIPLQESMLSNFNTSTATTGRTVNVTYQGCTTSYIISVADLKVTGIEVSGVTTTYQRGDTFDGLGNLIVTYEDGSQGVTPIPSNMIQVNTSTVGNSYAEVQYGGITTKYFITVTEMDVIYLSVSGQTKTFTRKDTFDNLGTITATLEDFTSVQIPLIPPLMSGFDTSDVGNKTVTVTYRGVSVTYPITVNEMEVTSIKPGDDLTKVVKRKSEFDKLGTINATLIDGSIVSVPASRCTVVSYDSSTLGDTTVTLEYCGKKCTYPITVIDMDFAYLQIKDVTTEYKRNSVFDNLGTVTLTYENGDKKEMNITADMLTGFDTSEVADNVTVTVSYRGVYNTYNMKVTEMNVTGISAVGVETSYTRSDSFKPIGELVVTYEDGTTRNIFITNEMVKEFDTTNVGTSEVVLTYSGHETSYNIEVGQMAVDSITVSGVKELYKRNDELTVKGTVHVTYLDGVTEDIPLTTEMVSGFDSSTVNENLTLTVVYGGAETSYVVKVIEMDILGSYIEGVETAYVRKDEFKEQGNFVITYEDYTESRIPITKDMVKGFDSSTVTDKQTLTVSWKKWSNTYDITISEMEITGISVSGQTTDFYVGDTFDSKGTLTITYIDGSTTDIPLTIEMLTGLDLTTEGTKNIVVKYGDCSTTYAVNVTYAPVTSIVLPEGLVDGNGYLTIPLSKTQDLDLSKYTMEINYSNGFKETKKIDSSYINGYDNTTTNDQTISIVYKDGSVSFKVKLIEPVALYIAATGDIKTIYTMGEDFTPGGVVYVYYSTGFKKVFDLEESMLKGFDTSTPGTKEITVVHSGCIVKFEIIVDMPPIESISINNDVTKDYKYGDEFDYVGTITAHFENGDYIDDISLSECTVTGFDSTEKGEQTVTVEYQGFTTTYDIIIGNPSVLNIKVKGVETYYTQNSEFDVKGALLVTYENMSTELVPVTQSMVNTFDTSTPGIKTVVLDVSSITNPNRSGVSTMSEFLSAEDKVHYDIYVDEDSIVNIKVNDVTTVYKQNQMFDGSGFITATHESGNITNVDLTSEMLNVFDTSTVGESKIVVSYGGKNAQYTIDVVPLEIVYKHAVGVATEYKVNGQFKEQGNIVIIYEDGSTVTTPITYDMLKEFDTSAIGISTVVLETEYGNISYDINVSENTVTDFTISNVTTTYKRDCDFDGKGTITLTYSDASTKEINVTKEILNGFDTRTTGKKLITVKFGNIEKTFVITVVNVAVDTLSVSNVKTDYKQNEDYVANGTLTVDYSDGSTNTMDVNISMLSYFDTADVGESHITLEYSGKSVDYTTNVLALAITGVTVPTERIEVTANGNGIDLSPVKIPVTYEDDSTGYYTPTVGELVGYNPSIEGEQEVTFTVGGETITIYVTVTPSTDGNGNTVYPDGTTVDKNGNTINTNGTITDASGNEYPSGTTTDNAGNITLPNGITINSPTNGDSVEITLPDGTDITLDGPITINPDGTITDENDNTLNSDGNIKDKNDNVFHSGSSVTTEGIIVPPTLTDEEVQVGINGEVVIIPGPITINPDGTIKDANGNNYHGDGTVDSSNGIITNPDGSISDGYGNNYPIGSIPNADGTITLPGGTITVTPPTDNTNDDIVVDVVIGTNPETGEDITVQIPVQNPTVNNDGSITDGFGNKVNTDGTITTPNGTTYSPGSTITPNGSVKDPNGNEVDTNGKVTDANGNSYPNGSELNPDGTITLPTDPETGTTITIKPNTGNEDTTITITGKDPITGGDITVDIPTDGDYEVKPDGSIELEDGTIIRPDGSIEDSDGNKAPIGSVIKPNGDIETPNGTIIGDTDESGDTTVTLPNGDEIILDGGVTVHPNGDVEDKNGNKVDKNGNVTDNSGTVYPGDSTLNPDGTITLPNDIVIDPGTITDGEVIVMPPISGVLTPIPKPPVINQDGSVSDNNGNTIYPDGTIEDKYGNKYPVGSTITPNGDVITSEGITVKDPITSEDPTISIDGVNTPINGPATINPNGTVTDKFGNTYDGNGNITDTNGNTYPSSSVVKPDGSIEDHNGNTTKPNGSIETSTGITTSPNGEGDVTIKFPNGETTTAPGPVKPNEDGTITDKDGNTYHPNGDVFDKYGNEVVTPNPNPNPNPDEDEDKNPNPGGSTGGSGGSSGGGGSHSSKDDESSKEHTTDKYGNTTYPNGDVVDKNGNKTDKDGNVTDNEGNKYPSGSEADGKGNVVLPGGITITKPEGKDEDDIAVLPNGDVVKDPNITVNDDGSITDSEGNVIRPNGTVIDKNGVNITDSYFGKIVTPFTSYLGGIDKNGNPFKFNNGITINEDVINGYITGYPNGEFKPNGYITREEFASIISRVFNIPKGDINKTFSDVNGWSKNAVETLASTGIVNGINDITFGPKQNLTRRDAAIMLSKIIDVSDYSSVCELTDIYNTYGTEVVSKLYNAGVINGKVGNMFKPKDNITRAEVVVLINKIIYSKDMPTKYINVPDVEPGRWYYNEVSKAIKIK